MAGKCKPGNHFFIDIDWYTNVKNVDIDIWCKGPTECGKHTKVDTEGPLFVADVPNWTGRIAPEYELRDESKAVRLEGAVWDTGTATAMG